MADLSYEALGRYIFKNDASCYKLENFLETSCNVQRTPTNVEIAILTDNQLMYR